MSGLGLGAGGLDPLSGMGLGGLGMGGLGGMAGLGSMGAGGNPPDMNTVLQVRAKTHFHCFEAARVALLPPLGDNFSFDNISVDI